MLILACSQRKRPDPGLLPAIERYDGPQFQVLRKFGREHPAEARAIDVYILSAKFGLIPSSKPIPIYDYKMTSERAHELHHQVLRSLKRCIKEGDYKDCFIGLGKTYLLAIAGYEQVVLPELETFVSQGSQGRRQKELRDWLYSRLPDKSFPQETAQPQGRARLGGVEIALTPAQVLEEARRLLANGQYNPGSYLAWYVQVDDQRVTPKWLVSQLTGLPVGTFHTSDARRVLRQLGIEVKQA